MRPIRLTFAGLRSYRSEAVIDFADLDLFAIVGDTGAGKSTIIEALSLALYAVKTWKGGSSKADMIADGESTLRIELVFAADERTWTVTRSWKRTGSPVSKLVSDDGEKVDGSTAVTERIEALLGLDHAQFTRAVVMPQGRFDELLRASATERSKLLASILGLDAVRRTGDAARLLRERWIEPLALARDRRRHLPPDPAVAVADAVRVETEVGARFAALDSAVVGVDERAARIRLLGQHLAKLRAAQAALPSLAGDPVAELAAADRLGQELAARHRSLTEQRKQLDAALARLEDDAAKLLAGFASRDAAVRARAQIETAAEHLRRDTTELVAARQRLDDVRDAAPTDEPDAALVEAVEVARSTCAAATDARRRAEAALAEGITRWRDVVEVRAALADTRVAAAAAATAFAAAELAEVSGATALADATDVVRAAREALDTARRADAAAVAGAGCEAGDDCPVCGQAIPVGYAPPAAGAIDDAQQALDRAEAAAEVARTAAGRAAGERAAAERDRDLAEQRCTDAVARLDRAESAASAAGCAVDRGTSLADDPPALVEAAVTEALRLDVDRATEAVQAAEGAQRAGDEALAAANQAIAVARARYESELEGATASVRTVEQRVAQHGAVVGGLPDAWRPPAGITADGLADLVVDLDAMLTSLTATDDERAEASATRTQVVAELDAVAGQAEREVTLAARSALATLGARFDRIRALESAMSAARATTDGPDRVGGDAAPAVTDDDTDLLPTLPATAKASELAALVERARRGVELADAAEAAAAAAAADLETQHDRLGEELAAALAAIGCETVDALRREHGVTEERLANATRAVAEAQADRAKADALDAFLAVADPFVANLSVLVEALRDKQFVGHLVKARELELISEANRRLRAITKDRFGFVGDFGVVSVASGEVRSPDALSGGERFQAALALALSLVEIASRGRGRLEAVFVDEGFGSLDLRSLDAALATLGEVAGGGKMVGLISHLKPVAEAVETVLLVRKDDVLGSTIEHLDAEGRERLLADDIRSGLTTS